MACLGQYCQSAGITEESLEQRTIPASGVISNGLALELKCYADSKQWTIQQYVELLALNDKEFCSVKNPSAVVGKLNTVKEQKRKLVSKKKVKGVKNVTELLEKRFTAPNQQIRQVVETSKASEQISSAGIQNKDNLISQTNVHVAKFESKEVQTELDCDPKDFNVLKYRTNVQERRLTELSSKVSDKKNDLENINRVLGHYSIKNVNKRDNTAKKNLHLLRDTQRLVLKQQRALKSQEISQQTLKDLQKENEDLKDQVVMFRERAELEKNKKVTLQKANSYLRGEINQYRTQKGQECECFYAQNATEDEQIKKLKLELEEKEILVHELEAEVGDFKQLKIQTKCGKGYSENVRLCIMELAGLEVATEKMSSVIQVVLKYLVNKDIEKTDLPNATTAQTIVDEGHYVAKAYIADKLQNSENWGLGRDGTTRRKHKIIDTAITLDTGDNISLGFTRVARETSETIQHVTAEQLHELSTTTENPHYLPDTLKKLSFTMSDRASNEKRADQLLDEWRADMLKDGENAETVQHYHCMAHVLLGFHNYTTPAIKEFEKQLRTENGAFGRDSLSCFSSWSQKESVVNRVVRTTSDTFGPAGDHLGVRDRWEAFCSERGIKSLIGNYRDNRFNAIFQTSAEVFLHRTDFIEVLSTVSKPNLKLKSVKSDLESKEVSVLLQCLGLFYLKLTGPYWNLITCGNVQYLELGKHIQDIYQFLKDCVSEPNILLKNDQHWSQEDNLGIKHVPYYKRLAEELFRIDADDEGLLLRTIPVIAKAMMLCIEKQLQDFLPGGKFYAAEKNNTTHFAPLTNLSCEHHFGDLDSSQRRRPRASYHHHSTVQLLKRNRVKMRHWLEKMNDKDRKLLLTTARKGGKQLRKKHMDNEKLVLRDIHLNMTKECVNEKKRKGTKINHSSKKQKRDVPSVIDNLSVNEYVVVAYQDAWYPGCVEELLSESKAIIKFMAPCRKAGHFQWPEREDRQTVCKQYILCTKFVPDCINSGRQWLIKEHESINRLYEDFHAMFLT